MPVRSHTIAGKRYRISTERLHGFCDERVREIYLNPESNDRELLGTIIHEAIHAAIPTATEAQVTEAEKAAVGLLLRLGAWKRKPEAFG